MPIGQIDQPLRSVSDDRLSLELQVKGFSDFILKCQTPMTIAIQGRWGSGKTSFVNMVQAEIQQELGDRADLQCPFVTFNAWQFSQFNMQSRLTTSMLSALTQEIGKGMTDTTGNGRKAVRKVLDCVNKIGQLAAYSVNDFVEKKSGIDLAGRVKQVFNTDEDHDLENDTVSNLLALQENFDACVKERLEISEENNEHRRLVIFVDDLDRLSPDKAIEVLEILKLFLDCRHCVFILAIDYSVVVNGVSIKYKNTLGADKGSDFFEKMIQVVYTMPEFLTHSERLIASSLRENGQNISLAPDFAALVKAAGKNNPRSIKRMLNSFYLLNEIQKLSMSQYKYDCLEHPVALFAALCLQIENRALFDYLQCDPDKISVGLLNTLNRFSFQQTVSPDAQPKALDFMRRIGLLDDNGLPHTDRCSFLTVFLRELYFSVNVSDYDIPFDDETKFSADHVELLRHCLALTELSQIRSRYFTDDDAVSSILLYESELNITTTGTIDEAFATTLSAMFPFFCTPSMAEQIVHHMDRVLSFDPSRFKRPGRIDLRTTFIEHGHLTSLYIPKDQNRNLLYYDADMTADQKVQALMTLAKHLDFHFTWFSDRTIQNVLVQYPPNGDFIFNPNYHFSDRLQTDSWELIGSIEEAPDFDQIVDLSQLPTEEIMRLTGRSFEEAKRTQTAADPIGAPPFTPDPEGSEDDLFQGFDTFDFQIDSEEVSDDTTEDDPFLSQLQSIFPH